MLCVQFCDSDVLCSKQLSLDVCPNKPKWGLSVLMDEISEFGRINPLFYFLPVSLGPVGH